jgi:5-methylcytosine-specific restriction endonuclease McrA
MKDIPARLRKLVIERADDRCEYCGLAQEGQEAAFHIDHIIPRNAGGRTILANLALACVSCSLRKGARQRAIDPRTNRQTLLFHPQRDRWDAHFRWKGLRIIGLTPTGRATIALLQLNRRRILAIRECEAFLGRHPPRFA